MIQPAAQSLAYFGTRQVDLMSGFSKAARQVLGLDILLVIMRDEPAATALEKTLPKAIAFHSATYESLGLLRVPISFSRVHRAILDWISRLNLPPGKKPVLAIEMGWGLETNSAAANFENWMPVAQTLSTETGMNLVSLYNRNLLIDEHLLAALRGHPAVLTSDGVKPNPHWLPSQLLATGTLREQVDFWLGGISPSLVPAKPQTMRHAAEGTDPMWLLRRSAEEPMTAAEGSRDRWKIRCFGRLRVYRSDGTQVDWGRMGGATLKAKTLFAYLLQQGGKGANADDLSDLLWPDADNAELARNRLHHTIRCLRQALNAKGQTSNYIIRDGGNYVLVPPDRSWLDISTFEQLCRQSQSHMSAGDFDEALICLQAADRLYTGDLFEDIPAEYIDDGERDWSWTKRYWLRDMFLKVQRDAARIYRQRAEHSAALNHCHKALAIDPLCEIAHEEAMHVFKAQGRMDAIERQYALYLDSLSRFDDRPRSESLSRVFKSLRQPA